MNHVYRLVWCRSRRALVAVSELASRRHAGATAAAPRSRAARLLPWVMLGLGGCAFAAGACAQSTGNAKLDDLQPLVSEYDSPVVGTSAGDTVSQVADAPVTVVRQVASALPVGSAVSKVQGVVQNVRGTVQDALVSARASALGIADGSASGLPAKVVGGAEQAVTSLTSTGGNLVGTVGAVVNDVTSKASQLPVAGAVVGEVGQAVAKLPSAGATLAQDGQAVVGQLGQTLGSVTSGKPDLGTALGTVVGGAVNHAAELPVVGSTVASVGQALKTVTDGGSPAEGLQGQAGTIVGGAVDSLSSVPGVGRVVAKLGQTLQETTAQIGEGSGQGGGGGGAPGKLVGALADRVSKVPVVGPVLGKVGGVLASVTSGDGDVPATVDKTVGAVTAATSKVPVVGTVVNDAGDVVTSVVSGDGADDVIGQTVDAVASAGSQLPVVGSVLSGVGGALGGSTVSTATASPLETSTAAALPMVMSAETGEDDAAPAGAAMTMDAASAAVTAPTVPPASGTPAGMIVGNGGVVGSVSDLLGSTANSLFDNSSPDGYITDGSLKVSNANFTQGYTELSVLGIPTVNTTPVGTVLTTVGGTTLGGTGSDSNLTLIGGVTSGNYISNINNGATGGLLGLVLPSNAPSWASTCLNVLGVAKESCWAVNAAQNNQVLVGDGASANGSEEVVIGTDASHTLPTESASQVFSGSDGIPTDDYAARLGHSVVIGDSASGTANAQTILGAGATSDVADSVALGYDSDASRGAQTNYTAFGLSAPQNSVGEVSIGSPGEERQITNVAAGSADTDAVNVAQLKGVAATADNSVQYDDSTRASVTLGGPASTDGGATGGTTITNLHQGTLGATSTDAVNGSQLFATNMSLVKYMGGTTNYDPLTNTWTAPTFTITSVATDGSTTKGSYDDVTDAFNAVDGSVNNLNSRINNIDDAGSKYFQANATGTAASAQGTDSVAVGPDAVASGDSSMAMGNGATASSADAVAIGTGAVAQNGSAVAIGTGNTADGNGAVALGDPNTATGQGAVALGYDNQASGQAAIAMGSTSVANGAGAIALGDSANASAANALAFGAGATANMANSIALGAGSSTTVGALTDYTAYGLAAAQTSAGEVNVGNRQITGVAAGSADDDAVNVAQLEAVDQKVDSNDKLAVKYDADSNGDPTDTVTLTGAGDGGPVLVTNLAPGAVTATSTDAVNGAQLWGWTQDTGNVYSNYSLYQDIQNLPSGGTGSVKYFNVDSTLGNSSATGSNSIAVGPQATASGTGSVAMGNGASATASNSVAIGAGSVADRANTVSVGSAGNDRQITNVAAGTADTDAVNVGQLDSAISGSTQGTVRYDTNADGSIDYNSVTLGDGNGDTAIHDVAAGTAATDAANVGQVQQAVDWSKTYTDERFDQIDGQMQRLGDRADAGVAAALATAGLPQAYEPGRSMAAISAGTFRGQSSIAIGVSTISEGGRWVYKVAGSADTRGDAGFSVGAGMEW